MRFAKLIAAIAIGFAALMGAAGVAHAASAVTGSVCRAGGGYVQRNTELPHVCIGGMYDGAEVWTE